MNPRYKVNIYGKNPVSPWLVPLGKVGKQEFVEISQQERFLINSIYENNDDVSSAIDQFLMYVSEGGIDITIAVSSVALELNDANEETRSFFTQEVLPSVNRVLKHLLLFGYVILRRVESKIQKGFFIFVVPPEGTVGLKYTWDKKGTREYIIVDTRTPGGGEEIKDAKLLIMDEPTDTGRISSRVGKLVKRQIYSEWLWMFYMRANAQASKPPYIWARDGKYTTETSLMSEMDFADASIPGSENLYSDRIKTLSRADQQVIEQAKQLYARTGAPEININLHHQQRASQSKSLLNDIISSFSEHQPWTHEYHNPLPSRLYQPPRPYAPDRFIEVQDGNSRAIYRGIGMPPDMLSISKQSHAANVEAMRDELNSNVKQFQRIAQVLLEEGFAFTWEKELHKHIVKRATQEKQLENVDFLKKQKQSIHVEVQFRYNPITTYERIKTMYDDGVIAHDTFQKYALQLVGMPETDLLQNGEQELLKRATAEAAIKGKTELGKRKVEGEKKTKTPDKKVKK